MNGAASGLIDAFKTAFGTGTDWDYIPSGSTSWYMYGSGGISTWGTLCGIPNGCIAILNMINLHGALAEQVLYHYCQTEYPPKGLYDFSFDPTYGWDTTYAPRPVPDDETLAYTTSNSPLCHASISKWCYAAGVNLTDTTAYATSHKNDRCGKICADLAAFTAELINYFIAHSGVENPYSMPVQTAECYACHKTNSNTSLYPAQCGKMDCRECHTDFKPHRALNLIIEDVWTADGAGVATNTFTAGNTIQCKVQFTVLGSGSCFMKTYKSRAAGTCGKMLGLPKSEALMAGTYTWTWAGTVPGGCTGNAKVIMDLKMFDYAGGHLIGEVKKNHNFTII